MQITYKHMSQLAYSLSQSPALERTDELTAHQRVALHHIYEYEKGIRPMVLCTLSAEELELIVSKLEAKGIAYFTQATPGLCRINLFFGRETCVETISYFLQDRYLHQLSPEQDFILGALLGYDLCGQCDRYRGRR